VDNACYPRYVNELTIARKSLQIHTGDPRVFRWIAGWLLGYSSDNTKIAYLRDINAWLDFCADYNVQPLEATRPHINGWARHLEQLPRCSDRTRARMLSAVSSWYTWLTDEGHIDASPATKVRRPKIPDVGTTPALTREQVFAFLAEAEKRGTRENALMRLLATTGIRIGEALGADICDLSTDRGHRILWITRKGGKRGTTVLTPPTAVAISEYLGDRTDGPLFLKRGARMTEVQAWRLVRSLARKAGIESADSLSPHSLRATFITEAREAGASLESVQDAAGHVDPRTTRSYDRKRHSLDGHAAYLVTAWFTPGS